MTDLSDRARGHWPAILAGLAGLTAEQLSDTHQPCPLCGGTDRYRFDDQDGAGTWFCNQCGGRDQRGGGGSGMDLLMRKLQLPYAEAARRVEQFLGMPSPEPKRRGKPWRRPEVPPADAAPPALDRGAVAQWCYRDADGRQLFWIQRIRLRTGGKAFLCRVWLDGAWHRPSRLDQFSCDWPTPRPLYGLAGLTQRPDAPVIITEGEKAADAAARMFPGHVSISWPNGAKAIDKADWQPLAGRDVILCPDADDPGRQAMQRLAGTLQPLGCTVATCHPPADAPEGWDLADADGWTPAQADDWLGQAVEVHDPQPAPQPDQLIEITESPLSPGPSRRTRDPLDGMPFRCLGFDRGQYFYLPDHSRQIVQLSPAQHSRNYLISIAPLDLWSARFGTVNDKKEVVIDWTAATDAMINACIAEGVYDPGRLRGRGAWIDDGRVIFHLGDRLLIDGTVSPIISPPGSRFFYEQGRHADGPSDGPLPDHIAHEIAAVADRFSWQVPAYSNLLLGWIVLAPVCGTLQWRPHIWITGSAGTGKTTVLRDFLRPLMGGIYETATAGTTEAGLRGQLRSDAIPVVFDEFEQNTASDKAIVQNVLQLARVASSDGGRIYKGTTTGGSVSYDVKSMFCVCSINVALIQKADADRFCVLSLRKDPALKDDAWRELEAAVHAVCTIENGRALVARTMANILTISANAVTFNRALATRFGQRFADQHAPLLAGAWSLQAMGGQLISHDMAGQWINSMDWDQGQADVGDVDEIKCRDAILQSLVRHPGGDQAALGEMVRAVALQQSIGQVTWPDLAPVLARHGLRVFRRGQLASEIASGELQCHYLAIANRSVQLQALLAQTPWSGGAHKNSLRRLDGAIATGPIHFSGVGSSRSVAIPISDADIS